MVKMAIFCHTIEKKKENDSQNVDKNDCLYVEHNPACENL